MNLKASLLIIFVLGAIGLKSQKVNIGWKRIGDVALYLNEGNRYEYNPLQLFNFYLEKPLRSPHFSVGIDLSYGSYTPKLTGQYAHLGSNKKFYDRSIGLGVNWRYYSKPKVMRFFIECNAHANYLKIYQPIIIAHDFGNYERIMDSEQWVASTGGAVGFSLGNKKIRWEPYIQISFISEIKEMRAERYAVSSIGIVEGSNSVFITPLAFKLMLD